MALHLAPPPVTLTVEEIAVLTGARRKDIQVRELDFLRIPYLIRSDGSFVVLRSVVERALGGAGAPPARPEPQLQP